MGIIDLLTGGVGKSIVDAVKDLADDFITTDEYSCLHIWGASYLEHSDF